MFTQHQPQHTTGLRTPPQWSLGKQVKDVPQVNIKLKLCFKYCVPLSFLYLVLSLSSICIPVICKILRETGKKKEVKNTRKSKTGPHLGGRSSLGRGDARTRRRANTARKELASYPAGCVLHTKVHRSNILVAKGGATQVSTDGQTDKENLVRIYSGILFSLKME